MKRPMELTLCPVCRQRFYDTGHYVLRRVIYPQTSKDTCTYCQVRQGYDYYVFPRHSCAIREVRV